MRDHESDKSDESGGRDRRCGEQRRKQKGSTSSTLGVDA
jgi:hypothetical protein